MPPFFFALDMAETGVARDMLRLRQQWDASYKRLAPYRKTFVELVRAYVGHMYPGSRPEETLVPLLYQTLDAYMMAVAANNPRVTISTHAVPLRSFARRYQVAINNYLLQIRMKDTMREIVKDALFKIGVGKVYQKGDPSIHIDEDRISHPGSPYFSQVAFDDYCHDMNARHFSKCKFIGDEYEVDLEAARDNEQYDPAVRRMLKATNQRTHGPEGETRSYDIARDETADEEEDRPRCRLRDVFRPELNQTWVMDVEQHLSRPLAVVPNTGGEFGPYKLLRFSTPPNLTIPVSPLETVYSLHQTVNGVGRKMKRQMQRQKDITVFEGRALADVKNVQQSSDGETVQVNNKDGIGLLKFGGIDPGNHQGFIHFMQLFDRMADNLPLRAGLGAQSDTATQDSILAAAVSKKEAQMLDAVVSFLGEAVHDIGYLMWQDDFLEVEGSDHIDSIGEVPFLDEFGEPSPAWMPGIREGAFWKFNFRVDPYSLPYRSPMQRLAFIDNVLSRVMDGADWLMQQGGRVDMNEYLNIVSELGDEPRLKEIIRFDGRPLRREEMPQGVGVTKRNQPTENIRRNISTGGTQASRDLQMSQSLQQRMQQVPSMTSQL